MKKFLVTILLLATVLLTCFGLSACGGGEPKALSTPTLSANGSKLNWTESENASGYVLKINEEEYSASSNSYDLSNRKDGSYICAVKAKGDGENYKDSPYSELVSVVVDTAAPEITATLKKSVYYAGYNFIPLNELTVSVIDQVDSTVNANIDKFYKGETELNILGQKLVDTGEYGISISAIDASGNKAEKILNFSVIADDIKPNLTISETEITLQAGKEFTLSENSLGLSVSDNSGEYKLEYNLVKNGLMSIDVSNGSFVADEYGYYLLTVCAVDNIGNRTAEKQIVLKVNGTYLYSLDNEMDFSNWVSNNYGTATTCNRELITEENGNKYASFKHSKVTFNVNLPNADLVVGTTYDVYMTVWTKEKLAENQTVTMEMASGLENASGELTSTDEKAIFFVQFTPTVENGKRFCTFYLTNNTGATLTYNIDNIMLVPKNSIDIIAPIVKGQSVISASANDTITLSEKALNLTVVEASDYVVDYAVKHNGKDAINTSNGNFKAIDGYYTITTTATDDKGNSSAYTSIVVVDSVLFDDNTLYKMQSVMKSAPNTFEAWLYLSKSITGKAGTVIGNFNHGRDCVNFSIYEGGNPCISFGNNGSNEVVFNEVDVRADDFVHVAIVKDGSTFSCYLNGVLKQTKNLLGNITITDVLVVGNDMRPQSDRYFKGLIKSVALYSDARTSGEIEIDMNRVDVSDNCLLASYNLFGIKSGVIEDLSQNGNDAKKRYIWSENLVEPTDYDYSFAVVGDIQTMTNKHSSKVSKIFDYIINNVESKHIKHVFALGDFTEYDTNTEWENVSNQLLRLSGKVSYSLVRGNHDGFDKFNTYLGSGKGYASQQTLVSTYQSGDYNSTAHKFTAGNTDWLVIALDYAAGSSVLEWAEDVVEANPNSKVIISTHSYLDFTGLRSDEIDMAPKGPTITTDCNSGQDLWDEFVKKHENIVMVLSGHVAYNDIVLNTSVGDNGNTIQELLINPQTVDLALGDIGDSKGKLPAGLVAMFYVSNDGKVDVRYYSTVREAYYMEDSQISFELDF